MIKNYNSFLLENIRLSNDKIIDIIKSLEGVNDKLVGQLVNHSDSSGKNVLMSIVQTRNEDLIDYILKFKPDINHLDKKGQNVLFYCKNIKTFNKFYNLGVEPKVVATNKSKKNVLHSLSSKKLFNVELYKKLINDGVSINDVDGYGNSVIVYSILNKGVVELLLKNGAEINDEKVQNKIFDTYSGIFSNLIYYKNKRTGIINIFKLLFENGLKIKNETNFSQKILELKDSYLEKYNIDMFNDFIKPLKNYLSEDLLIRIFFDYSLSDGKVEFGKNLLSLGIYPDLYRKIRQYYKSTPNYSEFDYYLDEHPYLYGGEKYNL